MIASLAAVILVVGLLVYSVAKQRAKREAERRSEARRSAKLRPQSTTASRQKGRLSMGGPRQNILLTVALLLLPALAPVPGPTPPESGLACESGAAGRSA